MDINLLLFSSILGQAELYLSNSISKRAKRKQTAVSSSFKARSAKTKNNTLDSQMYDAILKIKQQEEIAIRNSIEKHGFISKIVSYTTEVKEFVSEIKFQFRNFYQTGIEYAKSKYEAIKEAKKNLEGWQIGIEFSKYCNFIFFPKKPKKITGYLIDLGVLPDRINASPVLCYF